MKILRGKKLIGVVDEYTLALKTRDPVLREMFRQAREVGVRVCVGAIGPQGEIIDGYEFKKLEADPSLVMAFVEQLRGAGLTVELS